MPCPDIEDINMVIDIIKDYIYGLDIPLGTSKRLNCPVCNGNNTLSVTKFTDCIKYYCFHAECSKGGVIKEGLNESSFSVVNEMLQPNMPVGLGCRSISCTLVAGGFVKPVLPGPPKILVFSLFNCLNKFAIVFLLNSYITIYML